LLGVSPKSSALSARLLWRFWGYIRAVTEDSIGTKMKRLTIICFEVKRAEPKNIIFVESIEDYH